MRSIGEETFEVDLVDEERYALLAVSRWSLWGWREEDMLV